MSDIQLEDQFAGVNFYRGGGAAIIELNRPQTMNAWQATMCPDILSCLDKIRSDDSVRAVMITGAGRGFCAGADLGFDGNTTPAHPEGGPDLERALNESFHPVFNAIRSLPLPVLAGVNGAAAGIGMSLALSCDLVTMSQSARLISAFKQIGLGPDGAATLWLIARAGLTRASGIIYGGRSVEAEECLQIGLANEVLPDENFRQAVEQQLLDLANGPTGAFAATKRAINFDIERQLQGVLDLEAREQGLRGRSEDFTNAVISFMAKEPPVFTGR